LISEQPVGTNGMAVASLVLGILSLVPLVLFNLPLSILALVFGFVARGQIAASGGRQGGSGLALAGTLCGAIGLVFSLFWLFVIGIGLAGPF
jgi:hypothetical protein